MSRTPKFKVYGVSTLRTTSHLEIDVSFRIDLESDTQRLSKEQISAVLAGVAKVVVASKGLNAVVLPARCENQGAERENEKKS